jgi:predicted nucleotidyltransferase
MMSETKKVALVGWNPEVVDYSKWPGLTLEKLRAALEGDQNNLNSLGYDAELLYINDVETAYDTVSNALSKTAYDCVLIGAGVRTIDEHFLVFEKLVNAVHQNAPTARICFNTNPSDTAEAVQRWI